MNLTFFFRTGTNEKKEKKKNGKEPLSDYEFGPEDDVNNFSKETLDLSNIAKVNIFFSCLSFSKLKLIPQYNFQISIEQYFENFWRHGKERKERYFFSNEKSFFFEINFSFFLKKNNRKKLLEERLKESTLNESEKESKRLLLDRKETELMRLRRRRLTVNSFQSLVIIGRGAFGEVFFFCIKNK